MFENLLYQENVSSRLRRDHLNNRLPPALLFVGPPWSGKLTAALELARVFSCQQDAKWNCHCPPCLAHRELSNPRTLLLGYRDSTAEIAATAEVLRRESSNRSRYLFVRAVRKLLRRFDPLLWGKQDRKFSSVQSLMEELSQMLEKILPESPLPEGKSRETLLDTVVDASVTLQKLLPSTLPVNDLRHVITWSTHSVPNDHKTLIFDAAEYFSEGSRNALLKFLEEPPAETSIILLSQRKSLLLPTITSRLRCYSFQARRPNEEAEILRRVFQEKEERWTSLADYFHAWRSGPIEQFQGRAQAFLAQEQSESKAFPSEITNINDLSDFLLFLDSLTKEMQQQWRQNPQPDHQRAKKQITLVNRARQQAEQLNLPLHLVLRSLAISLGKT